MGMGLGLRMGLASRTGGSGAVAGVNATTYAIAPTVQYHPHTAAFTFLGGASTFNGSFDGTTNQLTLTSDAVGSFLLGQNVNVGAAKIEGMRIQSKVSGTLGLTGSKYLVGKVPNPAVTGVPMSTDGSNIILTMSDKRGYAPLTGTVNGIWQPPRQMTDAFGRKFVRLSLSGTSSGTTGGTFLANLAEALNLDTHNMTWMMVGRVHNFTAGCLVSIGQGGGSGATAPAASTFPQLGVMGAQISPSQATDTSYVACQRDFAARGLPGSIAVPTNAARLIAGTQMQLIGSCTSTTDGLGGTTPTVAVSLFHNEQTANFAGTPYASTSLTRYKGITGFEIGRWSKTLTQSYSMFDLYELCGWLNDELAAGTTGATRTATVLANAQAAQTAMLANWAVPAITDSVVLVTDSRGEFGSFTGDEIGMLLTDPGSPNALPATTRVIGNCYGGGTQETHWANMLVSPYSCYTQGMLGSGHDKAILLFGVNGKDNNWPSIKTANDTVARADEVYNGTDLDIAFTGYIDNGAGAPGLALTLTTASTDLAGVVNPGVTQWSLPIFAASLAVGTEITTSNSSTSYVVNTTQLLGSAGSPASFTSQHGTAYRMANLLLGRGWKVVTLAEIYGYTGSSGFGTFQTRFRDNIVGTNGRPGIQADLGNPTNHKVVDLAAISIGGAKILGVDAAATASTYYSDSLHPLRAGRVAMVSGGDTPANGLKAAAAMP